MVGLDAAPSNEREKGFVIEQILHYVNSYRCCILNVLSTVPYNYNVGLRNAFFIYFILYFLYVCMLDINYYFYFFAHFKPIHSPSSPTHPVFPYFSSL